jgi:predicted DNA-binding transcriptional regulator AlpA
MKLNRKPVLLLDVMMHCSQTKPLLLDAIEVAELLGIGRSLLYAMHSSGQLGPMPLKLGRCTRWRLDELERWVEAGCPPRVKWLEGKGGEISTD